MPIEVKPVAVYEVDFKKHFPETAVSSAEKKTNH